MAWTVTLSQIWQLDSLTALGFMALALYVGVRFLAYKGIYNDQVSFYFYNVRCCRSSPYVVYFLT